MNDYVLLFRVNPVAQHEAMGTPERAQQSMQKWLAWIQQLENSGNLKARGQPLDREGSVVRGQKRLVTDGPYLETKDIVAGFLTVQARDLAHAAEVAKGCPILEGGGSVEIRPIATI